MMRQGGRTYGEYAVLRGGAWALLLLAGALSACAGVGPARNAPGSLAEGRFAPGRPPVAQYGPNPELTCPSGGPIPLLKNDLDSDAKSSGRPPPVADGRLCAAAEALLAWPDKQPVSESTIRFVTNYYGNPSPVRRVVVATLETEDIRVVAGKLFETAVNFSNNARFPVYGAATQRLRKNATKIVLLLQESGVELAPVPRTVPAGSTVNVSGKLVEGLVNPTVLACAPTGKLTVVNGTGNAFQASVPCGDRPGRMEIEIRGERSGQLGTVASFPVECGSNVATSTPVPPPPAKDLAGVDEAKAARRMLELVNADRKELGFSPLAWDDGVARVARTVAEYLRDSSRGGATPAFDLRARLNEAGVSSPVVLQNPVAAPSIEEAHALIQSSAVNRANELSQDVTTGGVGVIFTNAPDVGPLYYIAELFVKELPPLDVANATARLREAIARRRADARAAPLANDPELDGIAQQYASELARTGGAIPKERESALVAPLYKGFSTVDIVSGVKADPLEFAEEPSIVKSAKVVGVGIASGVSPALGKNSPYVVIILGTRR